MLTPTLDPAPPTKPPMTETGFAQLMMTGYGHELRYCQAWRQWLFYDERRWFVDAEDYARRRVTLTIRLVRSSAEGEKILTKQLAETCNRAESRNYSNRIRDLAQHQPEMRLFPEQLDADAMLLNCLNGK